MTDTHFNLLASEEFIAFVQKLAEIPSDGLFISGDISSGLSLQSNLEYLATQYSKPIYFIIGNHDCYKFFIHLNHLLKRFKVNFEIIKIRPLWTTLRFVQSLLALRARVGFLGCQK